MAALQFRMEDRDSIGIFPLNVIDSSWTDIASLLLSYDATPKGRGFRLSRFSLYLLAQDLGHLMLRHNLDAEYDPQVRELLEVHVREIRAREDAETDRRHLSNEETLSLVQRSNRFGRRLTSEQIRDLGRLLKIAHGANFSVPGSGKTATLYGCYEALRGSDSIDQLLVVAPKNAFLSWEQESEDCYPDVKNRPSIARLAGGAVKAATALSADPEIALITYQFLPNVLELVKSWAGRLRTQVVLDESHRIKSGMGGVYAHAALELSSVAARRDILSGTPMPNSPEDLRAQIEFLWPGQRILPDERLKADAQRTMLGQVQSVLTPLYVRTTKQELNLPVLAPERVRVHLGPLQDELYELLRSESKRLAARVSSVDVRLLRRLGAHVMCLLEAASNPMLLASSDDLELAEQDSGTASQVWALLRELARSEKPAKVLKVLDIVESTLTGSHGTKVLIWTSFVENVLLLEKLLGDYKPVTLYGAVATGSDEDADTREGRIRIFHSDPHCRVMIANPAACGESISLHRACHHAIYLDRTFNAAHYLQSVDRIHRLGLDPGVQTRVQILEATGTIDSRVASRLKVKIDAMSVVLNDPSLAALAYDPVDVVEDFPAGIQPEDVEEIVDHIVQGEKGER